MLLQARRASPHPLAGAAAVGGAGVDQPRAGALGAGELAAAGVVPADFGEGGGRLQAALGVAPEVEAVGVGQGVLKDAFRHPGVAPAGGRPADPLLGSHGLVRTTAVGRVEGRAHLLEEAQRVALGDRTVGGHLERG